MGRWQLFCCCCCCCQAQSQATLRRRSPKCTNNRLRTRQPNTTHRRQSAKIRYTYMYTIDSRNKKEGCLNRPKTSLRDSAHPRRYARMSSTEHTTLKEQTSLHCTPNASKGATIAKNFQHPTTLATSTCRSASTGRGVRRCSAVPWPHWPSAP